MSKVFRPKRGTKSKAISQLIGNNVLKAGEIFFEIPDSGEGKEGNYGIKMGDGKSNYDSLPYILSNNVKLIAIGDVILNYQNSTTLHGSITISEECNYLILTTLVRDGTPWNGVNLAYKGNQNSPVFDIYATRENGGFVNGHVLAVSYLAISIRS